MNDMAEDLLEDEWEPLGCVLQKSHSSASSLRSLVSSMRTLYRRHTDKSFTSSDAEDESLQRYKQSLGLGGGKDLSDPNDPRVCIIQSLTMESPGRDPVVIDLTTPGSLDTLKKNPFKIKEGATFTMSATFKVQHEILSGLHYVQVIKRSGIRIPHGKTDEMIVSD
jgi:Rho GDP-dissociation inhibitor